MIWEWRLSSMTVSIQFCIILHDHVHPMTHVWTSTEWQKWCPRFTWIHVFSVSHRSASSESWVRVPVITIRVSSANDVPPKCLLAMAIVYECLWFMKFYVYLCWFIGLGMGKFRQHAIDWRSWPSTSQCPSPLRRQVHGSIHHRRRDCGHRIHQFVFQAVCEVAWDIKEDPMEVEVITSDTIMEDITCVSGIFLKDQLKMRWIITSIRSFCLCISTCTLSQRQVWLFNIRCGFLPSSWHHPRWDFKCRHFIHTSMTHACAMAIGLHWQGPWAASEKASVPVASEASGFITLSSNRLVG